MLEDVAVAMDLISAYSFELLPKRNQGRSTTPSQQSPPLPSPPRDSGDLLDLADFLSSPPISSPSPPVQATPPSAPTAAGDVALDYDFDEINKRIRVYLDQGR